MDCGFCLHTPPFLDTHPHAQVLAQHEAQLLV